MAKYKSPSLLKSGLTMSLSVSEQTVSIVHMDTITANHDNSVSSVLIYCKYKVLSPYFRLISFLGWRPLLSPILLVPTSSPSPSVPPPTPSASSTQPEPPQTSTPSPPLPLTSSTNAPSEPMHPSVQTFTTLHLVLRWIVSWCISLINLIYTLLILVLILSAYFLSYCTCYRGDGLPHLLPLIMTSNTTNNNHQLDLRYSNGAILTTNTSSYLVHSPNTEFRHVNGSLGANLTYSTDSNQLTPLASSVQTMRLEDDEIIDLISDSATCNNKLVSHFVIPDLLHFASYLFLLYLLRTPECERLENLMERGFLQLSQTTDWFLESRHLISTLRSYLLLSTLWIIGSLALHLIHFNVTLVNFNCFPDSFGINILRPSIYFTHSTSISSHDLPATTTFISDYLSSYRHLFNVNHLHTVLVYITVCCLTVFDIICSAVVTSYAVHCQLNISFINSLCQGVREKRISFQEFYLRAEESRKFVRYLNNNQAICVSLTSIVFICKICLYSFQLLSKFNNVTSYTLLILSALLWIVILLFPMIQGVRLTQSCSKLRYLGHELKARPFGYQHIPESEIDSLLAYTSSLDMTAKLFNLPLRSSLIVFILSSILIGVPLLGQINIISL